MVQAVISPASRSTIFKSIFVFSSKIESKYVADTPLLLRCKLQKSKIHFVGVTLVCMFILAVYMYDIPRACHSNNIIAKQAADNQDRFSYYFLLLFSLSITFYIDVHFFCSNCGQCVQ